MTAATITITEQNLYGTYRAFIQSLLDPSVRVLQGQGNRTAMPTGSFVVMQTLSSPILSTNRDTWTPGSVNPGLIAAERSMEWICQTDCYGDDAMELANIISLKARSQYGCDQFATSGFGIQPFYATEPRQTSMINGEQQYENRYTFELHAQYNPSVSTPQDFADTLDIALVEVDAEFPPGDAP